MSSPDEIDIIDFKIIKEGWNEYEINDDTILRARIFLTRLAEKKNATPPHDLKPGEKFGEYQISAQNNFQVFAKDRNKGKPTLPLPPINQIKENEKEEMELLTSSEPWNTYEVLKNGMIVRIKLVVSEIYRVKDKFDQFGEPYLIVKSSPVFDYKPPKGKEKFA